MRHPPKTVLLVTTRLEGGAPSGRLAVLDSHRRALNALGWSVEWLQVEPVLKRSAADGWALRAAVRSLGTSASGIARGWSLNEILFWSSENMERIRRAVAEVRPQWLLADMIRTAELALSTGLPVVVDLDDLLSVRYARLSKAQGAMAFSLGHLESSMPSLLRLLAAHSARGITAIESRLLVHREQVVAAKAAATLLVSSEEAARFAAGLPHAQVFDMPMTVGPPPRVVSPRVRDAIFVGNASYGPNLEALRQISGTLVPLIQRSMPGFEVVAVGPGTDALDLPGVKGIGVVPDVRDEVVRSRVMLAPIEVGSGIKSKVLEALCWGTPVVTTPIGVEGLPVEHGRHCWIATTARTAATGVARLLDDPDFAQRLAYHGRLAVSDYFSPEAGVERWRAVLKCVDAGRGD